MFLSFRKLKLKRLFDCYDANGNGHLDMNDAVVITNRFSQEFGWDTGSFADRSFKGAFFKGWSRMFRQADANHDYRITWQEFQHYHQEASSDDSHFYRDLKPFLDDIFPFLDPDGDGLIHKSTYLSFYRAMCNSNLGEEEAFESFDLNHDGAISHLEFYTMFYHFHMSADPDHASKLFFGQLENTPRKPPDSLLLGTLL
ncbi:EF-hand domain-containing protein [bacterium SCSIO 12741]|nr:EF-hand domain-containing protein [bacterium SCSIO 12741]